MKPDEIEVAFQRGKLSHRCPCGVTEAAGSCCSRCLRPMGPADWAVDHRPARSERLLEAHSGPEAPADGSVDPDAAQNGPTAVETVNRADPVRAEAVA
jgi:hypothetical protein